jgi:signal transduction histidine kinase
MTSFPALRVWQQVRRSSALRLALWLSGLFSVTGFVAGLISWSILGHELEQRLIEDAQALANGLQVNLERSGPEALSRSVQALSQINESHETLYFFSAPGQGSVGDISWVTPFSGIRTLLPDEDFGIVGEPAETLEPERDEEMGGGQEESYLAFGIWTPQGQIVVARDRQRILNSQQVLMESIGWGLGGAFAITMLLAFAIARRDARRIAQLNDVLHTVASGDFQARVPGINRIEDDLGQVGTGLNQMLERLETNVERLAQVSADIAHDLRSPLTQLRLRLEPHALRNDLPYDTRMAIAASLESLTQIAHSFDAILQLSQLETGNLVLETVLVNLNPLVQDLLEMLAPVAEEMGHVLHGTVPMAPVWVEGNAGMLSQALVNLINNALLHSPEPTPVQMNLTLEASQAVLSVSDHGPGIPPEEREKVLQRFYRLDRSRYRPGAGLGLSLVNAIVQLHSGRLELADNAPGLRVTLHLPVSAQPLPE